MIRSGKHTLLEPGCRHLVVTVDSEIFGNGTGDVRQHMVQPNERIAAIGDRFGVAITFLFEAEEYYCFERNAEALREDLGYDPAKLIREQIVSFIRRGHDVQLHLHPQWHGARYENGCWVLCPENATVDCLFETQEETTDYIRDRREMLEAILHEADPGRRVRAYRAGGFCAQPGEKLLSALADNGMVIDSSVVRGLHRDDEYACDYRNAPPSRRSWPVKTEVATIDPDGPVTEVPIYSVKGRRLHQFTYPRIHAKFMNKAPREHQAEMVRGLGVPANPLRWPQFLWTEVPLKLDFHNTSARTLFRWIRKAAPVNGDDPWDVLVLIGHSKEHATDATLCRLLELIAAEPGLKVVSFDQLATAMNSAVNP